MRLVLLSAIISAIGFAQTAPVPPNEFVATFASYQAYSHPAITGGIAYAYQLSADGKPTNTYVVAEYNVFPKTLTPFVLQSIARVGFCQQIHDWPVHLFTCAQPSIATAGAGSPVTGGFAGSVLADYTIRWKGKPTKWGIAAEIVGMKNALSDPGIAYELGIRRARH